MYSKYIEFIKCINQDNINKINFKHNRDYISILEHVTIEQGNDYLKLIENEFPSITNEQIINYVNINDSHGFPKKELFNIRNQTVLCSPTSIRYIYHSLLILTYYKQVNLNEIVEVGCGYGGLFLALCYFSKVLDIKIDKYYFIDLPEVCNLIKNYLLINSENININYEIHHSNTFGNDIESKDLFLISNYCFTEIDKTYRENYIECLIKKCKNGFITWQTVFGCDIKQSYVLFNKVLIEEERPQTASVSFKNYFVYFEN